MSAKKNNNYILRISMNVLDHLGLNLYSNNAAVLSEIVANSWDADATEVHINYSKKNGGTVTIVDNGLGMDKGEVQSKYLLVGCDKRQKKKDGKDFLTPKSRKPMGRKGIGKLSIFAIAEKLSVYTRKKENTGEAFELDAKKIKTYIKEQEHDKNKPPNEYEVPSLSFDDKIENGTLIEITQFKRNFTQTTFRGLKKRIARRFSIFGDDFKVFLDGNEITYADREYFDKARFLFQYEKNFSDLCKNLDEDENRRKEVESRAYRFNEEGELDKRGKYSISGWIAIAHKSNDLSGVQKDENLNNITLVVRGKVAQEDLLHEHRIGGLITKYIYGEIQANFLDTDNEKDIATSGRQKIIEDDRRYQALKKFISGELLHIWTKSDKLKEKKGIVVAMNKFSSIKGWYENLHESRKERARKIFGYIEKSNLEEDDLKKEFYVNGILAFERDELTHSAKVLEKLNEENVPEMLSFFQYVDDIEAALYYDIVKERLSVIKKLQGKTLENVLESDLRDYLFNHLWLFDPAWERATENAEREKIMQEEVANRLSKKAKKDVRLDIKFIKYRMTQRQHVIIELKRPGRTLDKQEIERQLDKYINAVKSESESQKDNFPIEAICIVGESPSGWDDNIDKRVREEKSLKEMGIRVMTYKEMIFNAESAYSKFLKQSAETGRIAQLVNKIRGVED